MHRPTVSPAALLRQHALRITPCRLRMLQVFQAAGYALPQPELEGLLAEFDRVTLYRTLASFEEKGLLHRVPDDAGAAKYALCTAACAVLAHQDDHVHFKCLRCGRTECLDEVVIPALHLPTGYTAQAANLLVQGVCSKC